jgi:hypothetical protein
MAQCEHEFTANKKTGEVKCLLCGDLDDEMQLFNKEQELKEVDDFYASQVTFE